MIDYCRRRFFRRCRCCRDIKAFVLFRCRAAFFFRAAAAASAFRHGDFCRAMIFRARDSATPLRAMRHTPSFSLPMMLIFLIYVIFLHFLLFSFHFRRYIFAYFIFHFDFLRCRRHFRCRASAATRFRVRWTASVMSVTPYARYVAAAADAALSFA